MCGTDVEQRIAAVATETQKLQSAIDTTSNDWDRHIRAAKALILLVDFSNLMHDADRANEQAFTISVLQKVAYHDADSGGVQDIADWCVTHWLGLLQRDDEDIDALEGLGRAWLSRSQNVLSRIHHDEGSSSSGRSSSRPGTGNGATYTSSDEARDAARAAAEADSRIHTSDYVEARGILLPSTEYFARAVTVAEGKEALSGDLLALTAEAYMSLGNVSYSYVNEQYFRQALVYLRRASQHPNYRLSPYLQNYLDDYGRLID